MPSSLTPNPIAWTHTGEIIDGVYDRHYDCRFRYWKHINRRAGGNAVVPYLHGGAWFTGGYLSLMDFPSVGKIIRAYFQDPTYAATQFPVDFVTYETPLLGHQSVSGSSTTTREVTIEGTHPGTGPISLPGTLRTNIRATQRMVQYLKRNALKFDLNPDLIGGMGESAGAQAVLSGAFSPSAPFTTATRSTRQNDALHDSRVRFVINLFGVIDMHPFKTWHQHSRALLGCIDNDPARVRAAVDKLLLLPDASGVLSATSAATPLCKSISPVSLIAASPIANRDTKIFSVYDLDEQDNTVPSGYTAPNNPYSNPHDPRQGPTLQSLCDSLDIYHELYRPAGSTFGGSRQLFIESVLDEMGAFVDAATA